MASAVESLRHDGRAADVLPVTGKPNDATALPWTAGLVARLEDKDVGAAQGNPEEEA